MISTSLVVTFHHLFTILCQKIQGVEKISTLGFIAGFTVNGVATQIDVHVQYIHVNSAYTAP